MKTIIMNELIICPISREIMVDPVMCDDGFTYERKNIEEWFKVSNKSPLTNLRLNSKKLMPNTILRQLIEQEKEKINNVVVSSMMVEEDSIEDSSELSLEKSRAENGEVIVSMRSDGTQRTPCTLICAIDVSGSMQLKATIGNDEFLYTRLDLVKHSLNTIITVLNDNDTLGLVKFSTNAEVIMNKCKMTEVNKRIARELVNNLEYGASTNLYDGIRKCIEMIGDNSSLVNILVLTDGEPNMNPPQGIIETLLNSYKNNNFNISTFGFGYTIDSELLYGICCYYNGFYGFIPDCSMLGTVFVNFITNLLLQSHNNRVSFLIKGQKKYVTLKENDPYLNEIDTLMNEEEYKLQKIVNQFKQNLKILLRSKNTTNIDLLYEDLKNYSENDTVQLLLDNIKSNEKHKGQIVKAVSDEFFDKWGQHYLLSIIRAHDLQICSNFKDQSVQIYPSTLFKEVRSQIDNIYNNIKLPEIKEQYNLRSRTTGSRNTGSRSIQSVTPAAFNTESTICFDGNGLVAIKNGHKKVMDLKKGDILDNGSTVICILKTFVGKPIQLCTMNEVLITPYHPVFTNKWYFPKDLTETSYKHIDYIYSIYTDNKSADGIININENKIATLAHGITGDVITHPYYGTQNIIDDLKKYFPVEFSNGLVNVNHDNISFVKKDNIVISLIFY